MDILFLSQYFYPEQFFNNHVARALVERGHRVNVVCCVPNYPAGRFFDGYSNGARRHETWEGVDIRRVRTISRGKSALQLLANYLAYPLFASIKLARLGRAIGDVSFVSMPSPLFQAFAGIFAKYFLGIPTVYWVQDIWPDSAIITLKLRNRLAVGLLNVLCGWIYRRADLILVQNARFADKIVAFGVARDRIATLPNGAPALFRPITEADVPARIADLVPRGRRTIMFAGNIGESQDFDTIIDAALLLPFDCPVRIVIVGSGRDEARVRARVTAAGIDDRFVFLGRHAEEDMPLFFACADAMLVSLRDEEIFALTIPSKVQCYLACGKPIVASVGGGTSDIVTDGACGIAVPPSDPIALSAAFAQIAALPDAQLSAMGERARAIFLADYALNAIIGKLEGALESVQHGPVPAN